jgi:hypothetical protein
LIDTNGRPVKRLASSVTPAELRPHIDAIMKGSPSKRRYENVLSFSDQFNRAFEEDDNSK